VNRRRADAEVPLQACFDGRPPEHVGASFDLDLLIANTRLRNRVKRLSDKLGWKHPLFLKTFSLLQVLEDAVTHDIV
jgi:hypothetical protein